MGVGQTRKWGVVDLIQVCLWRSGMANGRGGTQILSLRSQQATGLVRQRRDTEVVKLEFWDILSVLVGLRIKGSGV